VRLLFVSGDGYASCELLVSSIDDPFDLFSPCFVNRLIVQSVTSFTNRSEVFDMSTGFGISIGCKMLTCRSSICFYGCLLSLVVGSVCATFAERLLGRSLMQNSYATHHSSVNVTPISHSFRIECKIITTVSILC
jgi:hypothetical protein